jgi:hypothetical protein
MMWLGNEEVEMKNITLSEIGQVWTSSEHEKIINGGGAM